MVTYKIQLFLNTGNENFTEITFVLFLNFFSFSFPLPVALMTLFFVLANIGNPKVVHDYNNEFLKDS